MSTEPSSSTVARDGGRDLVAVGDVAAHGERPAAHRADLLRGGLGADEPLRAGDRRERAVGVGLLGQLRLDEQVGDHDVGARARERQRIGAAEAARAARDERDAPAERSISIAIASSRAGMKISLAITSRWICEVPS